MYKIWMNMLCKAKKTLLKILIPCKKTPTKKWLIIFFLVIKDMFKSLSLSASISSLSLPPLYSSLSSLSLSSLSLSSLSPLFSLSLSPLSSFFNLSCALLAWQKLYICIAKAIAAGLLTSSAHLNNRNKNKKQ